MSESPSPSPTSFSSRSTSKASPDIVIRDWPKIIMMVPTFVVAIVCGILMSIYADQSKAYNEFCPVHYIGLFFLLVLAINLTLLLYDLSLRGFIIVALIIVAIMLSLFLLNTRLQNVWTWIANALSFRVWANSAFYFAFAMVLLINLAIAWVITRFNYWRVEHNEIIIVSGFMNEQERHPTAQARFKMVIEDIVEYGLMGSGKLVFYFGDNNTQHELTTVLGVRRKAKALDELLGRIAVVEK